MTATAVGYRRGPLGVHITPLNARRLHNFRANRRGYYSLWIFLVLFVLSLFAEFIANDRPLVLSYRGDLYFPVLTDYAETTFGGDFETTADYRDPFVAGLIEDEGWTVWPLVPFSYRTINYDLAAPAPAPPSAQNWLGSDDQGRDVVARLIYGFRISVLFGLVLTAVSSVVGVAAGAIQGYTGGWTDLLFQRFMEIWSSLPALYLLIILAAVVEPNFWWLLGIMLLFSWMALVGVVRAEFLRGRNFDYVRAARALGVRGPHHHVPPRAAQRHGGDHHLPALYPQRLDHDADRARLSRLRVAARLRLARRALEPGQGQPARAVARLLGILRHRHHADAPYLRRRGGARRVRPAQDDGMRDGAYLRVADLAVSFRVEGGTLEAVRGVSFEVAKGETVALVGESGSGKSVSALSVLQLLPYPKASHPTGSIRVAGVEMIGADTATLREVRGNGISMIFQEPMTSLNPLHSIERQVTEGLYVHRGLSRAGARARTLELLHLVGLREAESRLDAYPHQLSGGQRQRVMIAMALANEPELLIADEPTTALDVTIQAQILELMKGLQASLGMAMLWITHDLGVVRKIADRVLVMREGEIVERGLTAEVFANPQHAYTRHLIEAEPKGRPLAARTGAPAVMATEGLKVYFPIRRPGA